MKQNIIIELKKAVVLKLKEFKKDIDMEHPVYRDFSILIPSDSIYDVNDVIESIAKKKNIPVEKAKEVVFSRIKDWRIEIKAKVKDDLVDIEAVDITLNARILRARVLKAMPFLPIVKYSNFEDEVISLRMARCFSNIISGVLYNLDSSNYTVVESKQRADAGQKKNKKKNKKSNVKYIYTKKYIVNDLAPQEPTEPIEREYRKDAWQVKGFWAKTRNGRVYWREPSIRRRRKGKENNNAEADQLTLKLNKVPDNI